MLLDKIKKANMNALKEKNHNARAIYSVLVNKCMVLEIAKKEKKETLRDADVVSQVQKTLKELSEEKENFIKVNNLERVRLLEEQEEYVKVFLPKMMSEKEMILEIEKLEDKSLPSIMKHFKVNFAGKVDMKELSILARKYQ